MSNPCRPIATRALVLAACVASTGEALAQERIRVSELRDGFTVFSPNEGSGNTIAFRGEDGTLLVDTMADSISAELVQALSSAGIEDVRYVANTHWHQNHLGGNDRFSGSAVVVGPESLRRRLQSEQTLEFLVAQTFPALPEPFWPNVTFGRSITLHFNGEDVEITHVRGHTDSDAIVLWPESRVAATGDLWRPGGWMVPDIDTGGTVAGVEAALGALLERVPTGTVIVPGHGRPGTVKELQTYVAGLRATIDYVRVATDAGRDLAQIVDEAPPEVADALGGAAARMLEAAYRTGS